MEIDGDEFAAYGKALAAAEIVGNVLAVPGGFLGEDDLQPLWVHPNYTLLEMYINFVMSGKGPTVDVLLGLRMRYQFHLVGTPGIGKSYFGHYLFYKQAESKKKAIWRTNDFSPVFLYYDFALADPLVSARSSYERPDGWTNEDMQSVWMVVDGECRGTIRHPGPILQCVSGNRSSYHKFSRECGFLCFLEAWSLEDLKSCSDAVGVRVRDLDERFSYCGGIPRMIFGLNKSAASVKGAVDEALGWCEDWKDVIKYVAGEMEENETSSDLLVHYKLPTILDSNQESFMRVTVKQLKFASNYVADRALDLSERAGFEGIQNFFRYCEGRPTMQSLAETIFERHVHRMLRNGGGSFKIRSLNCLSVGGEIEYCRTMDHWELIGDIAESRRRKRKKDEDHAMISGNGKQELQCVEVG